MGIFNGNNEGKASQGSELPGNHSFEDIFKEYFPRLSHFAFQILGDKENAEDIVQNAFITYWNQKDEVSGNAIAIKNFLYSTVRNASLNAVRHTKVVHHFLAQQEADPREEASVLHALIRSEVLSEIHAAIESLPPSCQRITRLGYLEGLKNCEIAQELGVSINTVKTQKQRGLQLLRLKLNPEMSTQAFIVLLSSLPVAQPLVF